MNNPKVSVIVPYPSGWLKEGCAESIKAQDYPNTELILIEDKNKEGASISRNHGAKLAKGDILFFVDCDTIMEKDCISKMVEVIETNNVDAATGIPLTPKNSSLLDYVLGLEYEDRFYKIGESFVDVAATTCFAIKRDIFEKLGKFEEEFGKKFKTATGEDWDFSAKLINSGFRIFHTNKARLYHYTATKFLNYLKKQFNHARYRIPHYKRHGKSTDKYTRPSVIIQSFLWLLLPPLLLIPNLIPYLLLLIFFWTLPLSLRMFGKSKSMKSFLILPLAFIRSFVWLFGAIVSLIDIIRWKK